MIATLIGWPRLPPRGNVTKRIGPAAAPGGQRPETLWTYDAEDRVVSTVDAQGHTAGNTLDASSRVITKTFDDATTEQTLYGDIGSGQEKLVLKTKDRLNVMTSYTYDTSGRPTQIVVGSAMDSDILDGQPDDSPITDRNQKSITSYTYLAGTDNPVSVIRDGSVTNLTCHDVRRSRASPFANGSSGHGRSRHGKLHLRSGRTSDDSD